MNATSAVVESQRMNHGIRLSTEVKIGSSGRSRIQISDEALQHYKNVIDYRPEGFEFTRLAGRGFGLLGYWRSEEAGVSFAFSTSYPSVGRKAY